ANRGSLGETGHRRDATVRSIRHDLPERALNRLEGYWPMRALFRRLPAYQLNGICVGFGVLLVYLLVAWLIDGRTAQAATTGAVYASLPHVVDRTDRVIRRVLVGGALACITGFVMVALADYALARGLAIALLAFVAMLSFAWGPRVGPIAFAMV